MRVRILSWNIHKGIGGIDRRYRLERVIDVLKAAQPDVCLLQEVADNWPPAGRDLQVERLAAETPFAHYAFSPEHRFAQGGYGNAILSRFPITDTVRIDLKIGWRKQRSALQACLALPDECTSKHLFATSLHLGLSEGERRKQLQRLFDVENLHSPSAPSLLGGDFNDVFGSLESKFLLPRDYTRVVEARPTFPAAFPVMKLDGIFGHRVKAVACNAWPTPPLHTASDHLPLIADCDLD